MVMLYFSGTGNSKYVAELFCKHNDNDVECYSIEENIDFENLISAEDVIAFCYPVYMSRVPRIMRGFVAQHMHTLKGKKTIVFCTQLILSGDGTRAFTMLFPKNHINVIYTEHFFMPNNMPDVPILPISTGKSINKYLVRANRKMESVCRDIQNGIVRKRGYSIPSRILGMPQGAALQATEKRANRVVSIDSDCTQCNLCIKICPMNNFSLEDEKVIHNHNCTMCYRCINACPEKAISVLFSGKIKRQYKGVARGIPFSKTKY
ncbi:MAG: EFR1 family ferrodoxin [Oscillospiraceae bacterium]|nr:EFR1 family ferrodoxin [Oscillospiraceae bacterium]